MRLGCWKWPGRALDQPLAANASTCHVRGPCRPPRRRVALPGGQLQLHWETRGGSAAPAGRVLLLNGAFATLRHYDELADMLAANGYEVRAPACAPVSISSSTRAAAAPLPPRATGWQTRWQNVGTGCVAAALAGVPCFNASAGSRCRACKGCPKLARGSGWPRRAQRARSRQVRRHRTGLGTSPAPGPHPLPRRPCFRAAGAALAQHS